MTAITENHMPRSSAILREIRSDVCNAALGWFCIFGTVAVGLSLLRILEFGWLPVMAMHIAILSASVLVYLFRALLPFSVRAGSIILIMYLVALGGHISFGPPTRIEFFIAATVMSAVFFGKRAGLISGVITVICIGLVYLVFLMDLIPRPHIEDYSFSITAALTHVGSTIVAGYAPLIAVTKYREVLERERERADDASKAKSDFLAMMSHELRTPMTAVIGMTDLIASETTLDNARTYSARISKSARGLLRLLNEVLDFSKIEANKLSIEPEHFSLAEIVKEAHDLFAPLASEAGLAFTVLYEGNVENSLFGDAGRIRQVLVNLIANAIKFTERGEINVKISQQPISENELKQVFRVSDTGIGISQAEQAQLFQPFIQAGAITTRRYGGTGLGLVISKRIAELMGGEINVISEKDMGTTFTFSLCLSKGTSPLSSVPLILREEVPSGLRVLVAEDDNAIAFLLKTMLARWGNSVFIASNGIDVIAAAESDRYDVILMDLHLPGRDGASATRLIRQIQGPVGRIPIIALTADTSVRSRSELIASGANALLEKPIHWDKLAAELISQCPGVRAIRSPVVPSASGANIQLDKHEDALDVSVLEGMQMGLGDSLFFDLLAKMIPTIDQHATDLSSATRGQNIKVSKEAAHSIKGVALQFGAKEIANLAIAIEQESCTIEEVTRLTEQLLNAIPNLKRALDDYTQRSVA